MAATTPYMATKVCSADCPERDPTVLEFDHVRGIKLANVSELIIAQNRKHLWIEIAKCDVVCANCHRRRTAKRGGWFKNGSYNALDGA